MPEPDDTILTRLNDLAACLCAELAALNGTDDPPTCLCIPIPGAFQAQAYSGEGEDVAWVRLADKFPSNAPGQQAQITYDRVSGKTLMIEVGVMRCHEPLADDDGTDEDVMTAVFTQQMRDIGAMDRAIECCVGRSWSKKDIIVGNYAAIGPQANMTGGAILIAMQI